MGTRVRHELKLHSNFPVIKEQKTNHRYQPSQQIRTYMKVYKSVKTNKKRCREGTSERKDSEQTLQMEKQRPQTGAEMVRLANNWEMPTCYPWVPAVQGP